MKRRSTGVRAALRQRIDAGGWAPGDPIPPEPELVRLFGISRGTVRQAVDALVQEGHLKRIQGLGTFVRRAPAAAGIWGFFHLYEDLRERGYAIDLRVVASQIVAADSPIAAHLDVPESAQRILIRRLVMLDGELFRLVDYFAPSNRFARLLEEDLSHTPLSELVQRHYGIHFTRLQKWLESALAQGEAAHLLGLAPGEPVLRIEVLAHGIDPSQGALPAASRIVDAGDDASELIDFRRILMRADKCRFFVEIEER